MFFDAISEELFHEIPIAPIVRSQVLLNIDRFEIGQSYVTAKIQNRYEENVMINIQGGRPGIELQESLFKIKNVDYITGTIENIALATSVKDVKLKIDYLSKTGTIISSQEIVIYDIVAPTRSRDFKEKIKVPEKTDEWQYSVVDLKTD